MTMLAPLLFGLAMTAASPQPIPFLALGDSYTIGEAVPEGGRWPVQLARALRAGGVPLADPVIVARTGWTTDELDAAIDDARLDARYGLVTLLIGVNDQYRGRPVEDYAPRFEALLARAIGFAGGDAGRVVVLSIPDWGVTPFAARQDRDAARIARELDAYNATARGIAQRHGVAFVDITAYSRGAGATELADDGLHPSAAQYAAWARVAEPVVRERLGR